MAAHMDDFREIRGGGSGSGNWLWKLVCLKVCKPRWFAHRG